MALRTLEGQVALVTGAGRGIGREVALGLAEEGMHLGILGRHRETLADTLRACVRHGVKCVAVAADVARFGAVREAVRSVERDLGPIDLLVNDAGQVDRAEVPLWEADPDQWWSVVETNLRGPFHLMRTVLPGMVERQRGRVVNLNSGFALRPEWRYSAYATSKSALLRLSDNVAGPLRPHGVTVLDISPGADGWTCCTAGSSTSAGTTSATCWSRPGRSASTTPGRCGCAPTARTTRCGATTDIDCMNVPSFV
jgi:3-oxoacyl-[acyl-carrier protein] reductase